MEKVVALAVEVEGRDFAGAAPPGDERSCGSTVVGCMCSFPTEGCSCGGKAGKYPDSVVAGRVVPEQQA